MAGTITRDKQPLRHIRFVGAVPCGWKTRRASRLPEYEAIRRFRGRIMDKFEEIGRRLDEEIKRLRHYVEEEVAPETERRTASFLRDASAKLSEAAAKLEARMAARHPPPAQNS